MKFPRAGSFVYFVCCCIPHTEHLANTTCSIYWCSSKGGAQRTSLRLTWKLLKNILEMPFLQSYYIPNESESLGIGSNYLCFYKSSRSFLFLLMFENHYDEYLLNEKRNKSYHFKTEDFWWYPFQNSRIPWLLLSCIFQNLLLFVSLYLFSLR